MSAKSGRISGPGCREGQKHVMWFVVMFQREQQHQDQVTDTHMTVRKAVDLEECVTELVIGYAILGNLPAWQIKS